LWRFALAGREGEREDADDKSPPWWTLRTRRYRDGVHHGVEFS